MLVLAPPLPPMLPVGEAEPVVVVKLAELAPVDEVELAMVGRPVVYPVLVEGTTTTGRIDPSVPVAAVAKTAEVRDGIKPACSGR